MAIRYGRSLRAEGVDREVMRNVGLLISIVVLAVIVGWMVSFGPKDTLSFWRSGCAHATSAREIDTPGGCRGPVKVAQSQSRGSAGAAPRR